MICHTEGAPGTRKSAQASRLARFQLESEHTQTLGSRWLHLPARSPSFTRFDGSDQVAHLGSTLSIWGEDSFLWGFPNTPLSCLFLLSHGLPPGPRPEPASCLPQVTGASSCTKPHYAGLMLSGAWPAPRGKTAAEPGWPAWAETGLPCGRQRTGWPL